MARMACVISVLMVKAFIEEWNKTRTVAIAHGAQYDTLLSKFRFVFFHNFLLSDLVPAKLVPTFVKFAENFYDKSSFGYHGIIEEIKDRVDIIALNHGQVPVREFLKHGDGQTDIYDSVERISYEKKTGCGDWLRSEKSTTFEEIIAEYCRKRTLIRWDYDFVPDSEDMNGKKSVNKYWNNEKKRLAQERTNKTKKDGTPIINKQYEIHIHIECSFRQLFDYMATYPKGLSTFFKESSRSGKAGVYCWEMQTLKNSKKKIEFLQACPYNRSETETETEEE